MKKSTNQPLYFIAADRLRTFRVKDDSPLDPLTRSHLVELDDDNPGAAVRGERTRDRPGRFEKGDSTRQRAGLAGGENHNRERELLRRSELAVSEAIEKILLREGYPIWEIVAPEPRLPEILSHLSASALDRLSGQRHGNWLNLPVAEIESRLL